MLNFPAVSITADVYSDGLSV